MATKQPKTTHITENQVTQIVRAAGLPMGAGDVKKKLGKEGITPTAVIPFGKGTSSLYLRADVDRYIELQLAKLKEAAAKVERAAADKAPAVSKHIGNELAELGRIKGQLLSHTGLIARMGDSLKTGLGSINDQLADIRSDNANEFAAIRQDIADLSDKLQRLLDIWGDDKPSAQTLEQALDLSKTDD